MYGYAHRNRAYQNVPRATRAAKVAELTTEQRTAIDALQDAINAGKVAERDTDFAADLIAKGRAYGPSPKQLEWIVKLTNRANGTEVRQPSRPTVEVGDMGGIVAMFESAKKHLKFPAIVLAMKEDCILRLRPAGERAAFPGSINVLDHDTKAWLGRVHLDGRYEASRAADGRALEVTKYLRRFAAEPEVVAKESATLTGACCYCHRPLKDERSTKVGYGPVCAKSFNRPY